jgi:shikimate dehydrogenase
MQPIFKFGLIGYPLGHSLSPRIHTAALKACGVNGEYALFPVPPHSLDELKNLLDRLRSGSIHGFNITTPHKLNIIPFLDELTPTAQAIGGVNTVYIHNSILIGDNTDAPAFFVDLQKLLMLNPQNRGYIKSALVLGAGGAARAAAYAEQAKLISSQFLNSSSHFSTIEFLSTAINSILPAISLLVNATPVGMYPNIDASPWPAEFHFPLNATVYDLVYNPQETKLVIDARFAGLHACTGLGMLIEQAALSFEIWTGCKPSVKDLTAAIT